MRLSISVLFATLAALCAADSMAVTKRCTGSNCSYLATFKTAYGSFGVDAAEGCGVTSVSGMVDFCVDWNKRGGHFRFGNQSSKRCMIVVTESSPRQCGLQTCKETTWD